MSGAASSSSRPEEQRASGEVAIISAVCARCQAPSQVRRPVGASNIEYQCPSCRTRNRLNGTIDAVCGSCRQVVGLLPPPGGGAIRFSCPKCKKVNQAELPHTMSVMCAGCRQINQVQAPPNLARFEFRCGQCATTNQVDAPTTLMCVGCRRSVQVHRPLSGDDFTFPCPHCGMSNHVKDNPKSVSVRVPEDFRPGDIIRINTPEGLKLEGAVPAGIGPGGVFSMTYQPRKLAKETAQTRLPLHTITSSELENAMDEYKECPICMEAYKDGDSLGFFPCFHRYHAACAKGSLAQSARCPLCNQDFHEGARKGEALLSGSNEKEASVID